MKNLDTLKTQDEETGLWIHLSKKLRYSIPTVIREEAMGIMNSIYHYNSPYSEAYAFNFTKGQSKKGISNGEFINKIDLPDLVRRYSFVYIPKEGFFSPLWSEYAHITGYLSPKVAEKWGISNKD